MVPKIKSIVDQILDKASPVIEERIGTLKEEAAKEFETVNTKLDKIIEMLDAK